MEEKDVFQRLKKGTMIRINNLDIAKRGVTFDQIINKLLDNYEKKD